MTDTKHTPTHGEKLYERANDARRKGDHENYIRLTRELITYNARRAALAKAQEGGR